MLITRGATSRISIEQTGPPSITRSQQVRDTDCSVGRVVIDVHGCGFRLGNVMSVVAGAIKHWTNSASVVPVW